MALIITEVNIPAENKDKRKEIAGWLTSTFDHAVKGRQTQIDVKYKRWCDNYSAIPAQAVRTTPFYKASNFVPQLIRMHTDILAARITGILFGTKPFWMPKSVDERYPQDLLNGMSLFMQHASVNEINLFPALDMGVFMTCKTGLCVLKSAWVEDSRWIASMAGQQLTQKEVTKEGLQINPIAFDDFFCYPVTAPDLSMCKARFHRLRFDESDVKYRVNIKWWPETQANLLLRGESPQGTQREGEAANAGIALSKDVSRPFTAIEAWFDYELEPGKIFPLVAVFNPNIRGENSLLKLYYNYYKGGDLDPFTDLRIMPRENLITGYCIPEILEQAQEEQAQIHNSRRDSNTIANIPAWKKKRLADVASPSDEWYPGKVFQVDNMDDLQPLTFSTNYNSLVEEEQFLIGLTERYSGISPAMQGFGAGSLNKRGVYNTQGTLAMLAEGNKRLDIYIKRMRMPMHRLGRLIWQSYRDFRSTGEEYERWGETGKAIKAAFANGDVEQLRGPFFEISASDASVNKETDRTALLLMSNTMAGYYNHVMQLSQIVAQIPKGSPYQEIIFQILDGARDLADRLLFVFDIQDRKKLVPDIRKTFQPPEPGMGGAGSAGGGPGPALEGRVPQAEEAVSSDQLAGLSQRIAALTSAGGPGAGEPGSNGRGVI